MSVLLRFRTHVGWTQSDLASALGATKAAVSAWENDARRMRPATAHRFIEVAREHDFAAALEDVYPAPAARAKGAAA